MTFLTLSARPVQAQQSTAKAADPVWCGCDCEPCSRRAQHVMHAPLVVSAVVARIHDPAVAGTIDGIREVSEAWPESELRYAWGDR